MSLLSPLPPHHRQALLLHCAFTCTRAHTHTACSLVIAVPVQFNVLQIGCMGDNISILLYQLRICRQLFLKGKRGTTIRVGKRSQVTGCKEASLPSPHPVPAKEVTPSIQVSMGPLFLLHLPQPLTWLKRCPRIISGMEEVRPVSCEERAGERAQDMWGEQT